MPTTPSRQVFEGVFIPPRPSTSAYRSSSKRAAAAAPPGDVTPPVKRVRTSASTSASSSSGALRTSSRHATTVSSSSRSHREKEEPRRTPTRIDVPKRGDRNGPSTERRSATSSRNTLYASERAFSSSDEDEIAIPVSSSSRRRALDASTRSGTNKPVASTSTHTQVRRPILPVYKTSSRQQAAISDLMTRKVTAAVEEEEEDAPIIVADDDDDKRSSRRAVSNATTIADGDDPDPAHQEAPALEAMDVDLDAADTSLSLGSTREPSPARSSRSDQPAIIVTPSKQRASAGHLSTPTLSAKKRTPTKAAKAADIAEPAFLTPVSQRVSDSPGLAEEGPASSTAAAIPDRSHRREDIVKTLHVVLERLSGPCVPLSVEDPPALSDPSFRSWLDDLPYLSAGHRAAERDIRNTLNRTIREGEGNCLLLVGERGIGKTAIIDRSLKALESAYGRNEFLVVRLSGLVQRDDKGALKEVARQLCSSAYVEEADTEGASSFTSNANILSSLLAILEPGPSADPAEVANRAKPLIFIIDEFDLFAHHSVRQSFLYCLLDCVQGGFRRGGMAVLGVSARADCIETLEKRVKSRCQSRVHHLLPAEDVHTGLALTAKAAMTVQIHGQSREVTDDWNANVDVFFSDKTVQMQLTCMDELRGLDADRKLFDILALLALKMLAKVSAGAAEGLVSNAFMRLGPLDLVPHIQVTERVVPADLSMAEMAMLIASKHLIEEERPFNFVIAYERYLDHCKRAAAAGTSSTRAFGRGLCLKAFERLKKIGLIKDIAPGPKAIAGGGSIFRLCRLIPWSQAIEDAVKERKDVPQHLVKWCKAWSE